MAHGFEIFNSGGQLIFSTESIAYFNVDVFEIQHPNTGQKTYSDLPGDAVLVADWVAYDFTIQAGSFGEIYDGFPVLSVVNHTVSWDWTLPNDGYSSTRAIVRVFAA